MAILTSSLSLSPRLETGKALSHAPDSLVAAVRSLVRALKHKIEIK